jgi:hypothetical protein
VVVMVGEQGFNLLVDQDRQVLPRTAAGYDYGALETALHKVKAALPDKNDLLVSSEDGITYDTLVRTMDTVLAAGFPTPRWWNRTLTSSTAISSSSMAPPNLPARRGEERASFLTSLRGGRQWSTAHGGSIEVGGG